MASVPKPDRACTKWLPALPHEAPMSSFNKYVMNVVQDIHEILTGHSPTDPWAIAIIFPFMLKIKQHHHHK